MGIHKYTSRRRAAEKSVQDFRKNFYSQFGVYPVVMYNMSKDTRPKIALESLKNLINECLFESYPLIKHKAPDGIINKWRKKELVRYRHCYFKLAIEMGYTCTFAGEFIGKDHATALHGKQALENLIQTKNQEALFVFNQVDNAFKNKYSHDGYF